MAIKAASRIAIGGEARCEIAPAVNDAHDLDRGVGDAIKQHGRIDDDGSQAGDKPPATASVERGVEERADSPFDVPQVRIRRIGGGGRRAPAPNLQQNKSASASGDQTSSGLAFGMSGASVRDQVLQIELSASVRIGRSKPLFEFAPQRLKLFNEIVEPPAKLLLILVRKLMRLGDGPFECL